MPGMLYGLDVIAISQKDVSWLEKAQREMGKWLLGAPPCVATEAVLGELGWGTVADRIARAKLAYWGYLQSVSEDRWCRKVFAEACREQTKWVQEIERLVGKYNLRGLGEVDVAWKTYIKGEIQKSFNQEWKRGVEEKSSLRAYQILDKPVRGNCWDGSKGAKILFQGRAGVVNVEKRRQKWSNGSDGKCKVCRDGVDETFEHLALWCSGYQSKREHLFGEWSRMDRSCESLEQVRSMSDNKRLSWFLGMGGGVPGSNIGVESVKGFLVECWDSRNRILQEGADERGSD